MSRNFKRIETALKEKGYILVDAKWEPLGGNLEMMGREGGWTVYYKEPTEEMSDILLGYNIDEVMEWVGKLAYCN